MMDLTPGQEVAIVAGTFAGHDGTVESVDDGRVTIQVDMYGRTVPVQVGSDEVRPGRVDPAVRLLAILDERMALATTMELNDWWVSHLDDEDADGHLWDQFDGWRAEVMTRRAAQRETLAAELASAAPPPDAWRAYLDEVLALGATRTDDGEREREAQLERAFALAQASRAASEERRAR